jgi:hypothetical protein
MALSKVDFNSINVTPAASKAIKFNSSNNGLETGDVGGSLVLISTQTASSSSTIDFTSGIDSTYKEYIFKFIDIHGETNSKEITFQGSTNSGSSYGVTITSTAFVAYHNEAGNSAVLEYGSNSDQAQATGFQMISGNAGNGNDESISGTLHLFDPSNTTFVKHFIARSNCYNANDYSQDFYAAGYFNTTSAIDAIQFKMVSGNIDAGTIKMYGVV